MAKAVVLKTNTGIKTIKTVTKTAIRKGEV